MRCQMAIACANLQDLHMQCHFSYTRSSKAKHLFTYQQQCQGYGRNERVETREEETKRVPILSQVHPVESTSIGPMRSYLVSWLFFPEDE